MMEQIGNIQEVVSSLDMLAVFSSLPIYIYIYVSFLGSGTHVTVFCLTVCIIATQDILCC